MTIQRVRVLMQNWPGAPGYINIYETSDVVDHAPYRTFFEAIKGGLPSGLTIQVPGTGDLVNEGTGAIVGSYSFTQPPVTTCTSVEKYAGGSGTVVDWLTGSVVAGRRPMGRTFLVPTTSLMMDTNGSLATTWITTVEAAGSALIAAMGPKFVVWSRPFAGGPGGSPPARLGTAHPVIGCRVPDLAATMRSRRT